jgi:hypothetical protein
MTGICSAQLLVTNLRCENRINPLGIDMLNPRFSWHWCQTTGMYCKPI